MSENNIKTYEFNTDDVKLSIFTGTITLDFYNFDVNNFLLHTHQWYELFYVHKGDIMCHFENEGFVVGEGEVIIVHPGELHYVSLVQKDAEYSVFNFYADTKHKREDDLKHFFDFSNYVIVEGDSECDRLVHMLKNAMDEENERLSGACFYTTLVKLCNLYGSKSKNIKTIGTDSNMSRIYAVESLIGKYFNTNITIDEVAKQLHVSKRQLLRIIKKHYGCTYKERIIKLRMEEAKRLLKNGEKAEDVAVKCGYDSVSAFYTAFRKCVGMLPGEYKKSTKS